MPRTQCFPFILMTFMTFMAVAAMSDTSHARIQDCGDGFCDYPSEDGEICYEECGYCGDGVCTWDFEGEWCYEDCGSTCGDGICWFNEDAASCPEDCAICGNGICSPGENVFDCPSDCGVCGDGICEAGEESTCFTDCGLPCWGLDTSCVSTTTFTSLDLNPILRDSPWGAYMVLEVYATFEQTAGSPAPRVFGFEDVKISTADGAGFHHDDLRFDGLWDPF